MKRTRISTLRTAASGRLLGGRNRSLALHNEPKGRDNSKLRQQVVSALCTPATSEDIKPTKPVARTYHAMPTGKGFFQEVR